MKSKKELEVALSRLRGFSSVSPSLEQYQTPSAIAADLLWNMFMIGDEGVIADLGCGTGILGFGALLLNMEKCFFVDIDENALTLARSNQVLLQDLFDVTLSCEFIQKDVRSFSQAVNVVVQNPPFGVQTEHADLAFLEVALSVAPIVYSFHTLDSRDFVMRIAAERGFTVSHCWEYDFTIKATMKHHAKKRHVVKVGCWRFKKDI